MTDRAQVVRVGRFPPADGNLAQVVHLVTQLAKTARAARGCLGSQVMRSDRDEAVVLMTRWESGEALTRWAESRVFLSIRSQIDPLLVRFPAFEHFQNI